jgi:tetratricopeptide (TPR) repeat protein
MPDNSAARLYRAVALRQLGDPAGALRDLDAVAQALPPTGSRLCSRGTVLGLLGRDDEARAAFDAAVASEPDDPSHRCRRANYRRGKGDREGALEDCAEALRLDPDHVESHHWKAVTLIDLGRLDEASAALDRALELRPRRVDSLSARVNLALRQHRYQDALIDARRAVALRGRWGDLVQHGTSLWRAGQRDAGVAAYRKALAVAPPNRRKRIAQEIRLLEAKLER